MKDFKTPYAKVFAASALTLLAAAALTSCSAGRTEVKPEAAVIRAPVLPQTGCAPEDCFSSAMRYRDEGGLEEAARRLEALRSDHPESVWASRAAFVLASRPPGSPAPEALFEDAYGLSYIADHVLFRQAASMEAEGGYAGAVSLWGLLKTLYPDSVLAEDAAFRRSVALMEDGRMEDAGPAFEDFIGSFPKSRLVPEALMNAARISEALGDKDSAAFNAREVLISFPAHPAAREAEAAVTRLEGPYAETLTPEESFERGERLFEAARYDDAVASFRRAAVRNRADIYDMAVLRIAAAEMRLKMYSRAERTLNDYLKGPEPMLESEALYRLSLTAAREGKEELLSSASRRLAARHPDAAEYARTLVITGRFYEGRGDYTKALLAYDEVLRRFAARSGAPYVEDALWGKGWIKYRQGDFTGSFEVFSSYESIRPQGRDAARFLYWSARSIERTNGRERAASMYRRIGAEFKGTYYSLLSKDRLGTAPDDNASAQEALQAGSGGDEPLIQEPSAPADPDAPPAMPPPGLLSDRHYIAGRELMLLGLKDDAVKEFDRVAKRHPRDSEGLAYVAGLLYRAGDYYRAFKASSLCLRTGAYGADAYAVGYPEKLVDAINGLSSEGSVDPFLVAAIAREESSYNPRAVSPTGALGMLQIMPSTGRLIAARLGKEGFSATDLFDPETSIEFGSWYLGDLKKRFKDDLVLAIAGYNAGPQAALQWASSLPVEADEFIESIPYAETRNYTKRVLKSYAEFRRLSGLACDGLIRRPVNYGAEWVETGKPGAFNAGAKAGPLLKENMD